MNRRDFLRTTTAAAVAAAAPMINIGRARVFAQSAAEYSTHAIDLVKSSLVVDMLHQIVYRIDQRDVLKRWLYQPGGFTDADFDQYRRSGISVDQLRQRREHLRRRHPALRRIQRLHRGLSRLADAHRARLGFRARQERRAPRHPLRPAELDPLPDAGRREHVLRAGPARVAAHLQRRQPARRRRVRTAQRRPDRVRREDRRAHEPGRHGRGRRARRRPDAVRRVRALEGAGDHLARQRARAERRPPALRQRRVDPRAREERRRDGHQLHQLHGEAAASRSPWTT